MRGLVCCSYCCWKFCWVGWLCFLKLVSVWFFCVFGGVLLWIFWDLLVYVFVCLVFCVIVYVVGFDWCFVCRGWWFCWVRIGVFVVSFCCLVMSDLFWCVECVFRGIVMMFILVLVLVFGKLVFWFEMVLDLFVFLLMLWFIVLVVCWVFVFVVFGCGELVFVVVWVVWCV